MAGWDGAGRMNSGFEKLGINFKKKKNWNIARR